MFFSDFTSIDLWPAPGTNTISQTEIQDDTGSTRSGSLRQFDCPVGAGVIARFSGFVRFFAEDEAEAERTIETVRKALCWVISFGSQRSTGFGRTVNAGNQPDVQMVSTTFTRFDSLAEAVAINVTTSPVLVDFTFQDPLCLPQGVINNNVFESHDEIPGQALRGALAELMRRIGGVDSTCLDLGKVGNNHPFPALCQAFDDVRIGMARPTVGENSTAVPVLPYSLVFAGERLFDFALETDTSGDGTFAGEAVVFCHDWKTTHWNAVHRHFHTVFPRKELRVRTAIESAANDGPKSTICSPIAWCDLRDTAGERLSASMIGTASIRTVARQ